MSEFAINSGKSSVGPPLIGARIKALREQRKLTQDSVARLFGFKDRQTVSAIETGDRGVTAEELLLAVEKLGASLEYFTDPFLLAGEGRFSWRHTGVDAQRLAACEHSSGRWIAAFRTLAPAVGRETPLLRRALGLTRRSWFEDAMRAGERLAAGRSRRPRRLIDYAGRHTYLDAVYSAKVSITRWPYRASQTRPQRSSSSAGASGKESRGRASPVWPEESWTCFITPQRWMTCDHLPATDSRRWPENCKVCTACA